MFTRRASRTRFDIAPPTVTTSTAAATTRAKLSVRWPPG